jgi:phosphoenolpyruvate-protein phosphotransferase (PTS system enzyme I)
MTDRRSLSGRGVSPGTGLGPVRKLVAAPILPPAPGDTEAASGAAEEQRALDALHQTAADLIARAQRGGGPAREVLEAQAMMADDPALADDVVARIRAGRPPAHAVHDAFGAFRAMLAGAGDYLASRVADLDDVRDRAVARLLGVDMPGIPESDEPFVLVARDLAPADTALLDPERVVAFVTEEGGPTSHTAILARAIGIPAVVACEGATGLADGTPVLVDGSAGTVQVAPDRGAARAVTSHGHSPRGDREEAAGPGRTADGHRVELLANIGGPGDVAAAVANGAEGVGLYRTEFLFLGRTDPPGEDEQMAAYASVLAAFPGGRVVVRVLDAGADKPLAFLPGAAGEPNPALGERGFRLLQRHPEPLRVQLRARAAAASSAPGPAGRLEVMAPMITDADEARAFADACREAGLTRPGIMIEVPLAALRAADLAREVDFFSVGTNDLTQYAAAADRQLGRLARFNDPWQPGILDLIAIASAAAGEAAKPLGVCGEAAADPVLACVLAGLGVSSLSMTPRALPSVRAALAGRTLAACRSAASAARREARPDTARKAALRALEDEEPAGPRPA